MNFFPYGTLAEIAQEIRSKNVSPVELVGLHLKRIETLQPKLNAFVHLDPEGALQQARAAEFSVARGAQLGPLHAVPRRFASPQKLRAQAGCSTCFTIEIRGRHPPRQHQHSRILDGLRNRQSYPRKN